MEAMTGVEKTKRTEGRPRGRAKSKFQSEKDLLSLLKHQDEDALRTVISKYHEKLFAVANRICRNPADSEEVLQDVYMTALSKIDKFEERSSLSTWLYRITVNAALMKLRSQRYAKLTIPIENLTTVLHEEDGAMEADDQTRSPIETLLSKELKETVENSLKTLPDIYKTVFVLRDIHGFSIKETSQLLQTTPAAIKSRLHRSRFFLREKLKGYEVFN